MSTEILNRNGKLSAFAFILLFIFFSCKHDGSGVKDGRSVKNVIENKINYLYQTLDSAQLSILSSEEALSLFSEDEIRILATRHWMFDVNVPVVVSVMRSTEQEIVPFWLLENGFEKTDLSMKNEQTTYEVWQKSFNAGRVGLGINGFENYSLHYFVSVIPRKSEDSLFISNFFPENQYTGILDNGSFTYHDWDELVLSDVPELMKGQKLLTTVRGRGTESHLAGAFRPTRYPSSQNPDQLMLTWSSDSHTGIDVQWRTDSSVNEGILKLREAGKDDEITVIASKYLMVDPVLMNDPAVNRFTAKLRNLKPGTRYQYLTRSQAEWTSEQEFTTAAADDDFTFIWFGDTHHSPEFGKLINAAENRHPETAFYTISGDIVSDGLHRDQWDDIFGFTGKVISRKPLMCAPGNHDNRSGLGALMYRELFSYPLNGPAGVEKEQTYSFTYKNALFLMIDATSPIDAQTQWIEDQLAGTDAAWKFAVFHFPPYSSDGGYPEIRKKWCTLFDKYHVNMVMSGHVHNYLRTKPMNNEIAMKDPSEGTIYLISIAIPDNDPVDKLPYAESQVSGEMLYQKISVKGNRLDYKAMNIDGVVRDHFTIMNKN